MKRKNYIFILFSTFLFVNCASPALNQKTSRSLASHNEWVTCYNKDENRLYFQTEATYDTDGELVCKSNLFYAPKDYGDGVVRLTTHEDIITETPELSDTQFGAARQTDAIDDKDNFVSEESDQVFVTHNGRKITGTHWGATGPKRIIVMVPNFETNQVEILCDEETLSDELTLRADGNDDLYVKVLNYKNAESRKRVLMRKKCGPKS